MFVLVIGGGKVGYYLTKELIDSGHEVVLMEKDRARADQIADEIGSIVIPQAGSPAVGRAPKDLSIPEGCSLFAVIRDGVATALRSDTPLREGDKVIAIGRTECERLLHDQLIGNAETAEAR